MANPTPSPRHEPPADKPLIYDLNATTSGWTPFLGRVLLAAVFILGGLHHFTQGAIQYAAQSGLPYPSFFVPASGIVALIGGVSVLLGYRTQVGAGFLIFFIVPVTFVMHAFWTIADPAVRAEQQGEFLKNLGLLGCALYIGYFGPGKISIDGYRASRASHKRGPTAV